MIYINNKFDQKNKITFKNGIDEFISIETTRG